jgi:hypothetical protein
MSTTKMAETGSLKAIEDLLGSEARPLLEHRCQGIPKDSIHLPGPDFVDRGVHGDGPARARAALPPADVLPRPAWPAPATSRSCP